MLQGCVVWLAGWLGGFSFPRSWLRQRHRAPGCLASLHPGSPCLALPSFSPFLGAGLAGCRTATITTSLTFYPLHPSAPFDVVSELFLFLEYGIER
ncbi:hypothetical protein E2C01_093405 [Portunus trituberculatus]|uniref:Uncharacterized protein n=1 Tax=Portunus trituberculatus TaxID=210409 RepID=A0A5B7JTX2_PORTR|nr:hypothetical protein [Portunus trituberculatus]